MHCTGGQAVASYNASILGKFHNMFTGIKLNHTCDGFDKCLLTVCSGSVSLWHSTIAGLHIGDLTKGLLCVTGNASLSLHSSVFSNNNASSVLVANDNAQLLLHSTRVANNTADLGVVTVLDNVNMTIAGCSIFGNKGSEAIVGLTGNSHVTVDSGSAIRNNIVTNGGGGITAYGRFSDDDVDSVSELGPEDISAVMSGTPHVTVTGRSTIANNTSADVGGGIAAMGSVHILVANGSVIANNVAPMGGGIAARGNDARVTIDAGSSIRDNMAPNGGGAIMAIGRSSNYDSASGLASEDDWGTLHVTVTGRSTIVNNSADMGGGILAIGSVHILVAGGSGFSNNVASVGGGIAALGNFTCQEAPFGSSLHADSCRFVNLTILGGSHISNNSATTAQVVAGSQDLVGATSGNASEENDPPFIVGGGVFGCGAVAVQLSDGSSISHNTADIGGGVCLFGNGSSITITGASYVQGNRALNGSGGGLALLYDAKVDISRQSRVVGNICRGGMGGGLFLGSMANVTFAMGRRVMVVPSFAVDEDLELSVSVGTGTVSDSIIANNTSTGHPGGGLGLGSNAVVKLSGSTRVVGNRAINTSGGGAVLIDNATLELGSSVVFLDNAVSKGFVGSIISAFDNSSLALPQHGRLTKCSRGVYLGTSTCAAGEVMQHDVCVCCPPHIYSFTNTSCEPCPAHARCTGGSLIEPVEGYWRSSTQSVEMHRCPLYTRACGEGGRCKAGYRGNLCGVCQLPSHGMVSPLKCRACLRPQAQLALYFLLSYVTVLFIGITVHVTWADSADDDASASVNSTDLIKVLVQFAQYMVIVGTVAVPWPERINLQRWFQAVSSVFGAGSGHALSLDCWLAHYALSKTLPLAIQRQLVYFLAPFVVFLGVVVLQLTWWAAWRCVVHLFLPEKAAASKDAFAVLRKLPLTALIVMYYAYPSLLRASIGFFACMHIDNGPGGPDWKTPPLNHALGFWVNDIQQACFTGYHRSWALGLGLPAVIVLCVAVPVCMGLGLRFLPHRAPSKAFREYFSFLSRSYTPERRWWEAVWAGQTVVMTCVSAFAFPMGPYFSILGLLVVFLGSATLQGIFRPYAVPTLHRLHITSTACLACTTLGALALFAYEIEAASAELVRTVITVLVLLLNTAFMIVCGMWLAPVAVADAQRGFKRAAAFLWDVWDFVVEQRCHRRHRMIKRRGRSKRRTGCMGV